MAATYEKIATNTLGNNTATVTFNSISGSYTDLVVVISGYMTSGAGYGFVRVNGDTGSNYSRTFIQGDGSSAIASGNSNDNQNYITMYNTNSTNAIFNFMNYSNTTTYKTYLSRDGGIEGSTIATVNLWRSTSAITSISFIAVSNFISGSTFTLYGILKA